MKIISPPSTSQHYIWFLFALYKLSPNIKTNVGTKTELRALQQRPATGFIRSVYLFIRMYVLRGLRGERA